jgi:PAS domain S-box-containing protein
VETKVDDRCFGQFSGKQENSPFDPLLERIPVPCFSMDAQGAVQSLNQSGAWLLGKGAETVVGQPFASFVADHAKELFLAHLSEAFTGESASCELPLDGADGSILWVLLRSRTGQASSNGMVCVSTAMDITYQKLVEDQLKQAQKTEAIGTLAEGIAYDFNNLLQALYGNVQLLLSRKMDEGPDVKPLREMERITKRAADIVRHLLTFSRKMKPSRQFVDINQIVGYALNLLHRTIPRMISLRTDLRSDLPAFCADPNQMEQILVNLVKNGCDAIRGQGTLVITTGLVRTDELPDRRRTDSKKESHVLISVKDTGCGMDSETLKRIYEPFFTTKEVGKGLGLGLSTVYGIVKAHNGLIRCESAPGKGTTFSIYLPLDQSCALPEPAPPETPLERSAAASNRTILVVDDEEIIREITSEILRQSGYRVLTAESGEEGMRIYREHKEVDLVLLDLGMPGMGGEKCLEELFRIDEKVRVVITTGYAKNRLGQDGQERIAAFLSKPYDYKTLLRTVREGLGTG